MVGAVGAVGVGVGADRRRALRSSWPLREHAQRYGAPGYLGVGARGRGLGLVGLGPSKGVARLVTVELGLGGGGWG